MIVIGMGHRARQGKSLACATIVEQCSRQGVKCREYSISEAIKKYCVENDLLPDIAREQYSPEQIAVLVEVGRERRAKESGWWSGAISEQILEERPAIALIPNVRFPDEADLCKSLGGFCVEVVRYNENGTRFISPDRDPNTLAETSLEHWPWDFRIVNMHGKIYWLRRQAIALFEYLRDGAE